jgi:hypothetical protein
VVRVVVRSSLRIGLELVAVLVVVLLSLLAVVGVEVEAS